MNNQTNKIETVKSIIDFLDVNPTDEQTNVLNACQRFFEDENMDDFLIIRGSAGTGKTTIVKAITHYLNNKNINFALCAPTGKAANVLFSKTNAETTTIHSLIYNAEELHDKIGVRMVRKANTNNKQEIYIVDEASMLSDVMSNSEGFIAPDTLLNDLIRYVKMGNASNKLIFIGDEYQLRPINSQIAPALSPEYLHNQKGLSGTMVELTEVKRQDANSYILSNATKLRNNMITGQSVGSLEYRLLQDANAAFHKYIELYEKHNFKKVSFIAWTNNDVNWQNATIRTLLGHTGTICINEQVLLNQTWYSQNITLQSGETGSIVSILGYETFADLEFAHVEIAFPGYNGEPYNINTLCLLNSFHTIKGALEAEQEKHLYSEVMRLNTTFRASKKQTDDKYLSAIRLRYAYALTCHKAQGSEWDHVILHPKCPTNDTRWKYTAITRAAKELYTY